MLAPIFTRLVVVLPTPAATYWSDKICILFVDGQQCYQSEGPAKLSTSKNGKQWPKLIRNHLDDRGPLGCPLPTCILANDDFLARLEDLRAKFGKGSPLFAG